MMSKKREYTFDVLRVIAMIMVIIVHVSNLYSRYYGLISNSSYLLSLTFNTISRISVPLFFMISGALLLDRSFNKDKYIKRILRFLIVIVVWDIIYLVWEYLFFGTTYNKLYTLSFEPFRSHLWFLYTIIVLYIIQPLLKFLLDKLNSKQKMILFIIWFLMGTFSMFFPVITEYYTTVCYIGYFILGKYLYDFITNNDLSKYNVILIIMTLLCFIASIFLNYSASVRLNMFYNSFFAYRTPYIILASILFFILVYNLVHNKEHNKIIKLLSDLSFGVYLIHGIFLDITFKVFNYRDFNSLIGIPLFVFIIFIFSVLSVYLLRKSKLLKKVL